MRPHLFFSCRVLHDPSRRSCTSRSHGWRRGPCQTQAQLWRLTRVVALQASRCSAASFHAAGQLAAGCAAVCAPQHGPPRQHRPGRGLPTSSAGVLVSRDASCCTRFGDAMAGPPACVCQRKTHAAGASVTHVRSISCAHLTYRYMPGAYTLHARWSCVLSALLASMRATPLPACRSTSASGGRASGAATSSSSRSSASASKPSWRQSPCSRARCTRGCAAARPHYSSTLVASSTAQLPARQTRQRRVLTPRRIVSLGETTASIRTPAAAAALSVDRMPCSRRCAQAASTRCDRRTTPRRSSRLHTVLSVLFDVIARHRRFSIDIKRAFKFS